MMHSWLSLIWDKSFGANTLIKKYRDEEVYFLARRKTVISMEILAIILLSIFVSIGMFVTLKIGSIFVM